jgi:hypothetical protein
MGCELIQRIAMTLRKDLHCCVAGRSIRVDRRKFTMRRVAPSRRRRS